MCCFCWSLFTISVLTVEPCEAEHADLFCDVVPRPWCPQTSELFFQLSPHQQDPVSHGLYIVLPWSQKQKSSWTLEHLMQRCERCVGIFSAHHSVNSSGVFRVMATTRAPWDGGLDHVVLTIFSIWDRILFRLSASLVTMVRLPTRSSDGVNILQQLLL